MKNKPAEIKNETKKIRFSDKEFNWACLWKLIFKNDWLKGFFATVTMFIIFEGSYYLDGESVEKMISAGMFIFFGLIIPFACAFINEVKAGIEGSRSAEYTITDYAIEIRYLEKKGKLKKCNAFQIKSISLVRSFTNKLLNTGDIVIKTKQDKELRFHNIKDYEDAYKQLMIFWNKAKTGNETVQIEPETQKQQQNSKPMQEETAPVFSAVTNYQPLKNEISNQTEPATASLENENRNVVFTEEEW